MSKITKLFKYLNKERFIVPDNFSRWLIGSLGSMYFLSETSLFETPAFNVNEKMKEENRYTKYGFALGGFLFGYVQPYLCGCFIVVNNFYNYKQQCKNIEEYVEPIKSIMNQPPYNSDESLLISCKKNAILFEVTSVNKNKKSDSGSN